MKDKVCLRVISIFLFAGGCGSGQVKTSPRKLASASPSEVYRKRVLEEAKYFFQYNEALSRAAKATEETIVTPRVESSLRVAYFLRGWKRGPLSVNDLKVCVANWKDMIRFVGKVLPPDGFKVYHAVGVELMRKNKAILEEMIARFALESSIAYNDARVKPFRKRWIKIAGERGKNMNTVTGLEKKRRRFFAVRAYSKSEGPNFQLNEDGWRRVDVHMKSIYTYLLSNGKTVANTIRNMPWKMKEKHGLGLASGFLIKPTGAGKESYTFGFYFEYFPERKKRREIAPKWTVDASKGVLIAMNEDARAFERLATGGSAVPAQPSDAEPGGK